MKTFKRTYSLITKRHTKRLIIVINQYFGRTPATISSEDGHWSAAEIFVNNYDKSSCMSFYNCIYELTDY